MRWCGRCRRRFYEEGAYCPFDGSSLDAPDGPTAVADAAGSSHPRAGTEAPHPPPMTAQPTPARQGAASPEPPSLAPVQPAATDTDPHLGVTLLGQVHVLGVIGSGAMGTVYRAWQSGMERPVAVKLLRADLIGDPQLRRRFLREARAAARLSHPNIVCVHLVGETDAGVPYLVMEHLGGQTVEEVLAAEGTLAPGRAVALARQIASALAEAHGAGVVHRDLKPANVLLVERRGLGEVVKILDFGIAKVVDAITGDASRLTRQGTVFGTPHYIAPEQAQGAAIDGRADLYSLGVLLYRMLSGGLPFDGSAVAVLLAHISRRPPPLAEVAPGVDPRLAEIVDRCLAKDPAARWDSAEELLAALEALDDLPGAGRARAESGPLRATGDLDEPAWASIDSGALSVVVPAAPGLPAERSARRGLAAVIAAAALAITLVGSGTASRITAAIEGGKVAEAGEAPAPGDRPNRVDGAGLSLAGSSPAGSPPAAALDPGPRRAVLVSEGGFSVRALVPETLVAGEPVEVLLDVWDADGEPLDSPFIEIAHGATGEAEPAPALAGLPGRYRYLALFSRPGEAVLHLDLPDGGLLHLHLDVQPRPAL